ncbi:ferredoxin--NADP reductase, root isozyme, chloroplastic-like isoform X1 [Humulus lupulus]|uniref:ferredoxin--NADP reductase, root isozyme, chloroplastic-like isoform X1 n=1 Tax=Humulus lupulus TaxID=3486 RepID=UPI002B408ADA|nr:ferredoxin--NADP reductase, root isozyme, chloroplastic-like isoform X1 [Humulus lupulus]
MALILHDATTDVRRVPVRPLKLEDANAMIMPPTNLYTPEAPHTATILSVRQISHQIYEIVFDHRGFMMYLEGQAFGVMVPPNPNNPFEPERVSRRRIIFAASSRYGEYFNGRSATICVSNNNDDETIRYLCNAKSGCHLQLVGPTLTETLLGDSSPAAATHIFVAKSGAAIAPFRAHLHRFFREDIPEFKFSGDAWLFYGARNNLHCRLYDDEFMQYEEDNPQNFHYNFFIDILDRDAGGLGKMVFDMLVDNEAYIYLVGSQEMVDQVEVVFRGFAGSTNGQNNWTEIKDELVSKYQWRVEIYD